jgi:hypothetical protein
LGVGNYNGPELRAHLETHLNINHYMMTDYAVDYDEKNGTLSVVQTGAWHFPTRSELTTNSNQWNVVMSAPDVRACHDVIGYSEGSVRTGNVLQMDRFVDLMPFKQLFLCSSDFGNTGQSLGPVGQSDIVRRVVISAPFGNAIHDQHSTHADYVNVSLTQISQMRWRLTDERGRAVSLRGHGISFSICFLEKTVV